MLELGVDQGFMQFDDAFTEWPRLGKSPPCTKMSPLYSVTAAFLAEPHVGGSQRNNGGGLDLPRQV